MDVKFNILDDHATGTKASFVDVNYSKLETELKDYVIKQEVCARLLMLSVHLSSFFLRVNLIICVLFLF